MGKPVSKLPADQAIFPIILRNETNVRVLIVLQGVPVMGRDAHVKLNSLRTSGRAKQDNRPLVTVDNPVHVFPLAPNGQMRASYIASYHDPFESAVLMSVFVIDSVAPQTALSQQSSSSSPTSNVQGVAGYLYLNNALLNQKGRELDEPTIITITPTNLDNLCLFEELISPSRFLAMLNTMPIQPPTAATAKNNVAAAKSQLIPSLRMF